MRCERRSFRGSHCFEAPLSEISPTFESVVVTSFQNYFMAAVSAALVVVQYYPIEEISVSSYWWSAILLTIAAYFYIIARISSGSYVVLRSTKESSRDIWILRNGAESEVDAFITTLRARLHTTAKTPKQ